MIIAQISDPHIGLGDDSADPQDRTAVYLRRAVDHLMRLPTPPDVVLITGDCVDGGSMPEYQRFRALLGSLTMSAYVVPGNHDNREQLQALFGAQGSAPLAGFVQYVADIGPVRLIALDTNVPGKGGRVSVCRTAGVAGAALGGSARTSHADFYAPPAVSNRASAVGYDWVDQRGYAGRGDRPPSSPNPDASTSPPRMGRKVHTKRY